MFRTPSSVSEAWSSLRGGFMAIAVFSLVLNLLMLAGPLYMLQVYDRVLTSQNMDTLIALSLLLAAVFVVTGCLDLIRMRILGRLAAQFERRIGLTVLQAAMRRKVQGNSVAGDNSIDDLNGYRDFISGTALIAYFDAPWIPLYIGVLYVLHPFLGLLGLAGAVTLAILALINNARSHKPMQEAFDARARSDALFQTGERNAELIHAMGMQRDLAGRWSALQVRSSGVKTIVTDRIATFSVFSKTIRMGLQSAILGLGAALAISGESTAGVMIAATIVLGRALAPIDQVIGQWRTFLAARGSFQKLSRLVEDHFDSATRLRLPSPYRTVDVTIRQAGPPLAETATLAGISFRLCPGDSVAVIGQSGSGKSTLAKMLAGVWIPQRGEVSFDGISTTKWRPEDLGRMIGYLPQEVELFDGTIRENIARFSTQIDDSKVLNAALTAGVHEMIVGLPDGYETELGKGFFLSGGQRQRIALARALYDDPFLLVLDEPNSDLDTAGDIALRNAIASAQDRGAIVIVMTHRPSTLQAVNKVLMIDNGSQRAFGPKDDVLKATTRNVLKSPVTEQAHPTDQPAKTERAAQ
ncbi:MAG: type I secretion system permease/ATPase [Pseudomonadota bacterium]